MKFAAFILIAAAVVVNAAALQPRIAPIAAGQLCAATGTVTIQGITQPIPPISATCDVGLSCSATQTVEALPDLGNLLGSVTGLLSLLTSLPIIGSLPIVSGLLPLVTGLLNLGILDGLLDGLLGGVLGSLGTANVAATTCA